MTAATFHPGKKYKTRGGFDAAINQMRDYDRALEGWVDLPDRRVAVVWQGDGRICTGGIESNIDLMPAEEDLAEEPTSVDAGIVDGLLNRIRKLESQTYEQEKRLQGFPTGPELLDWRRRDAGKAEVICEMASKIEALTDRLDGTDRRVSALREGLNDAVTVLGKHESQINGSEDDGVRRIGLAERIGNIQDRVSQAEQHLARIEDMLTSEKGDKPARKSLGWIAAWAHPKIEGLAGLYWYKTREEAIKSHGGIGKNGVAIVELFEGDGL